MAAVDAHAAHVMLVAERHRLVASDADLRVVRRTIDFCHCPNEPGHEEGPAKDTHPRDGIRTGMEYLWHSFVRET